MIKVRQDLTNKRFGHWLVIKQVEDHITSGDNHIAMWQCQCDCGTIKNVSGNSLKNGTSKSCGCCVGEREEGYVNPNKYNLVGKRFGRLVVLSEELPDIMTCGAIEHMWRCKCDCGNEIIVRQGKLIQGKTKSCGCYRSEVTSKRKSLDLTGQRFGNLFVVERVGSYLRNGKKVQSLWKCRCDCGNEKILPASYLRSGDTSSCGCLVSKGEAKVAKLLNENGINFKQQYYFDDLLSSKGFPLLFDFAIFDNDNDLKYLIEYQGAQHYQTDTEFGKQQRETTDLQKKQYCRMNNIVLHEIRYDQNIEKRISEILDIQNK